MIEAREDPDQIAAQMVAVSPADYDALQQRCRELDADLRGTAESYALRCEDLQQMRKERDALHAEVERLREALSRIHTRAEAYAEEGIGIAKSSTLAIEEISRAALEGSAWNADTAGSTPAA
ncbi:hypothetical protein D3C78_1358460 [compost metagenome]